MPNHTPLIEQATQFILKSFPDVNAIYLFGSIGNNFANSQSDIDLAILPNQKISAAELWQTSQKIAVAINRDVDLINLKDASTVFRFQIISTGKRIYCSDQKVCDEFEMLVYSSYLRFNEERKEILKDIENRGQIYNG